MSFSAMLCTAPGTQQVLNKCLLIDFNKPCSIRIFSDSPEWSAVGWGLLSLLGCSPLRLLAAGIACTRLGSPPTPCNGSGGDLLGATPP